MKKSLEERREYQRQYRLKNNNVCTKKYEKTQKGFLMRLYRNMLSRIYEPHNMEWVTHSENSRRGAIQRYQKNLSYS